MLWPIFQFFAVAAFSWVKRLLSDVVEFAEDAPPAEDVVEPKQPINVTIIDESGNQEHAHCMNCHDSLIFQPFSTSEEASIPRADDLDSLAFGEPLVMLVKLGELAIMQDLGGTDGQGHGAAGWASDSADVFVFAM